MENHLESNKEYLISVEALCNAIEICAPKIETEDNKLTFRISRYNLVKHVEGYNITLKHDNLVLGFYNGEDGRTITEAIQSKIRKLHNSKSIIGAAKASHPICVR